MGLILKSLLHHPRLHSVLMTCAYLALLTIADCVISAKVDQELRKSPDPSTWDLGLVMVSTVSDITGQLLLGAVFDAHGRRTAMLMNTTSLLLSTFLCFPNLLGNDLWAFQAAVISPLLRLAGGATHATLYLALLALNVDARGSVRIALFWATGAINHLTQFAASALAAKLSSGTIATSCFVSTAFILAAYVVIARCKINCRVAMIRVAGEEDEHLNAQDTSLARLIPASLQDSTTRPWTALALNRSLLTTTFSLSLIGVAKAASPFFGLYVRQKFDFSFSKVDELQRLELIVTLTVYLMILPCILFTRKFWSGRQARDIAFLAAIFSALFVSGGALGVGLARVQSSLLAAFTLQTLGSATELSILAFAAFSVDCSTAGRLFMMTASFESLGNLVGTVLMQSLFPCSSLLSGYAEGLIFYVKSGVYIVVFVLILMSKLCGSCAGRVRLE